MYVADVNTQAEIVHIHADRRRAQATPCAGARTDRSAANWLRHAINESYDATKRHKVERIVARTTKKR